MPVTQGTAILWGVSATNMTGFSAHVSGGYTFTEETLTRSADKEEIRNRSGEVATVYFYNGGAELSLKCYPSGASASAQSMPLMGDAVTVYSGDTDIAGEWVCEGATKSRKQDGVVEFDITLKSYDAITDYT